MFFRGLTSVLVVVLAIVLAPSSAMAQVPQFDQSGAEFFHTSRVETQEIVFIHGMFFTPRTWDGWIRYFKQRGYQVTAPAWPLHEGKLSDIRSRENQERLADLGLEDVLDHYRFILSQYKRKPILVGHSMGGLIAQVLLSEGWADAAIAISSAPPQGLVVLDYPFIRSNWEIINPLESNREAIEHDLKSFSYAFLNEQPVSLQPSIYSEHYVPESRRVGRGVMSPSARIDSKIPRGPLLLIAGAEDRATPARLIYKNFKKYRRSPAYTEFQLFEGRDHWIVADPHWREVAASAFDWIESLKLSQH